MPYAGDVWLPAIAVTAANNSFRVVEDPDGVPVVRIVTITAGTYYLHDDSSLHPTLPGLYVALATAINAVATETYSFEAADPTLSTELTNGGLTIRATNGTEPSFEIDWGHASMTMDPGWFGWRTGKGGLFSSNVVKSTTDGGTDKMTGNYSVFGRWYSFPITSAKGASDKRSTRRRNVRASSPRLETSSMTLWDTSRYRSMQYAWLKSPHIFPDRADDSDTSFIDGSGLAASDIYNGFLDVWLTMSKGERAIIVHGSQSDLQVDVHDYELVKMSETSQARDFRSIVVDRLTDGEYYDLGLQVWVDPDHANYAH